MHLLKSINSGALINSIISHDEFDSINSVLKEYNKMKEKMNKFKDLIKFIKDFSLFIKQCFRIA